MVIVATHIRASITRNFFVDFPFGFLLLGMFSSTLRLIMLPAHYRMANIVRINIISNMMQEEALR